MVAHVLVHRLALHEVEHPVAVLGHFRVRPAGRCGRQRRHRHQHVQRRTALGRKRAVQRRRRVAVKRRVVGKARVVENVVDVALEIGGKADGMHRIGGIAFVQAQVQDEARAGVLHVLDLLRRVLAARVGLVDELGDGVREVGVAHHVVGVMLRPSRLDAAGAAVLHHDALHRRGRAQLSSLLEKQSAHGLRHRVHAALHEPHAVHELDHRDDHVQRRAFERRDADVERLKRERLAQPVVLHMARHRRVRVAQRMQAQTGHEAFRIVEVGGLAKRALQEVILRDEIALVQKGQVLEVALRVLLAHGLHGGGDGGEVVRQAQAVVGAEGDVHERLDLLHGNVVVGIAAARFEHLAVQLGHHDDGGPHVEGEPFLADLVHLAAHKRLLLEERHLVSGMLQARSRRQTGNAGTDHDNPFHATPSVEPDTLSGHCMARVSAFRSGKVIVI